MEHDSYQPSPALLAALDRCNRTELYQLCVRAKKNPPSHASREELVQLFLGVKEPHTENHNIDLWREGIKGFVKEHFSVLQPQLTCPIRQDIDGCKGCLDVQVVSCIVEQKDCEPLIQLHRK